MTISEFLKLKGLDLFEKIKYKGWALPYVDAHNLLFSYEKNNILVLGFDVYDVKKEQIIGAWGILEINGEQFDDFQKRSIDEGKIKLRQWFNEDFLYVLVPFLSEDRQDSIQMV